MTSSKPQITNIVCYLRRSRQDIEKEKKTGEDTLLNQKKLMVKVLDDMGIPYDTFEEIGSGDRIDTRPVFQHVLNLLEQEKYNTIAVKEIARLGRGSYSDMGQIFDLIKEKRIFIINPYKIYDIENSADARQIRFELFFAREEYEMIKERMYSSKITLAYEGRWIVGAAPFGYQLNSKTTMLDVDEEKSKIIQMIFDLYTNNNYTEYSIATYLNQIGFDAPRNSKWRVPTIKRILQNVVYIGTLKYRTRKRVNNKYFDRPKEEWIVVENAYEPIIDKETWEKVQEKMKNNYIPRVKIDFSPCELAGLVICKKCGRRMVKQSSVQHYHKKNGTDSVYHKEFLWCTNKGCTFVKYRDVEKDILKFLEVIGQLEVDILKQQYEEYYIEKNKTINIEVNIEKKKNELKRRLEFIYDKFESGVYSNEEFLERKSKIEKEVSGLNDLPKIQTNNIKTNKIFEDLKLQINNAVETYKNEGNKTVKNNILLSVIDKVFLTKTGKGKYDLEIIPRFII
jgi:DNA invertase Pin-like site-specific DNA recombinase